MLLPGDFFYRVEVQEESTGYWKSAKFPHENRPEVMIVSGDIFPEYNIVYNERSLFFFKWYDKHVKRTDFDHNQRHKALEKAKKASVNGQCVRIAKYSWNTEKCEKVLEEVVWHEGKWL